MENKLNRNDQNLEDLVLETLSYFEAMTYSKIIFDFDSEKLKSFPSFHKEELQEILKRLIKKNRVKKVMIKKELGWIKIQPKRFWWKRILSI